MQELDDNRIPRSALLLGLLGVVPFWGMALLASLADSSDLAELGLKGSLAYGAVILSFLGGIRWGAALRGIGASQRRFDFAISVIPSLAGWAALLIPAIPAVSLLIAGLLMQSLWDVTSTQEGRLPGWFAKLRVILTGLAVCALMLLLGRLLLPA